MKCFFRILILLFFLQTNLYSQTGSFKSFTPDSVKFIEELEDFFKENSGSNNEDESRAFIRSLKKTWVSGKITESYKQTAYRTSNLMLKKHLRPFPDFKNYFNSLVSIINSGKTQAEFNAWQACVDKILDGKFVKFLSDYLFMSDNLFTANTFYKSAVVNWSSNNANYQFQYDSVPKVIFSNLNLKGTNGKGDSAVIYNTKGIYYPFSGKFIGNGGKVNWLKAGFDENQVYAEISKYDITVKTGSYTADTCVFYNKLYFGNKSLKGKVLDRVLAEAGDKSTYPRFESYTKRFQIKNIAEGVDYDGGFSVRGSKYIGSGSKGEDAKLIFRRNNKPFLVASSLEFNITKEKVTSFNAAITIYIEEDSIYHPNLSMKFFTDERRLSLIRSEEGVSRTPFFDTYHDVEMYFEELTWKIDDPRMEMKALVGSSQNEANFESTSFFREARYDRLQGMSETHPLVAIKTYMKKIGDVKEFFVDDIASHMKITSDEARPLLVKLSSMGFISYDTDDDKIYVKDKLINYTMNRAKKLDYDIIDFRSENTQNFASINLLNNDLSINGVNSISLSDSQNVVIYPKPNKIVVKKNRDFLFGGIVNAGKFEFFGKEFSFEYDRFKVNLTNVDSLRLKAQEKEPDANGNYKLVRVKTVIEGINGELYVDNPANKSGIKRFVQYPIFKSNKESYAFYDKKSIQNGTYGRDRFYFKLDPFTIDSLDNFENKSLRFNGTFASAGIFPSFTEELTLQEDYSLGFIRDTPPEGYNVYINKGTYKNKINLSNKGLRGDGTLDYVTSTTTSNDFIFFPDSMNTMAQKFYVKEQLEKPQFPEVTGENVYVHWLPQKDKMYITKKQKNINCFKNQAEFQGTLLLTPEILTANGSMYFADAILDSRLMKMASNSFDADTANFALKSGKLSDLTFATVNVNAKVDFTNRKAEFKSNGKGSVVKFPANQYICFMDKFTWYMDSDEIELGGDKKVSEGTDIDLDAPEFISTHPNQDSLRFYAPRAKYDIRKNIITALEVSYINVADARIFPDSGRVVIKKNADMQTLKNSKITANTVTQYHNLYNVNANVLARKNYTASGYYDYVDELNVAHPFYFSNIKVDTTIQTIAETDIPNTEHFMLSPNYEFQGKVQLFASSQFLKFTGAVKIQHACEKIKSDWTNFSAEIYPKDIKIPILSELKGINNENMSSSLLLSQDSIQVYSTFLSPKSSGDDILFNADGVLYYNKSAKEYQIAKPEKLIERNIPGNFYSLNTNKCIVYGEGKLSLGEELGQVKLNTVGNFNHFTIPDSIIYNSLMLIDFFFDPSILSKMADAINNYGGLKPVDFSTSNYEKGLRELIEKEKADKLISQLNLYGSFKKFPDELEKTLFLNDITFKWDRTSKSYKSLGKVGVGNVYKNQVNKYVDAKIEFTKKKAGDIFTIYIELDGNNWYFFSYTKGLMQVISSNETFNTAIKELKADKRKSKAEAGQKPYQFNLSTVTKKTSFIRKFDSKEE